jgi:hypothetical protein
MSGVFRNIDPPPPHRPASVYHYHPAYGAGGGHTRWVEGVGGSVVPVLYICKYFVLIIIMTYPATGRSNLVRRYL